MTTLFYLLAYLALLGFVVMAYQKITHYLASSPLHLRWELYPVPHEGKKAEHGGSIMEEKEWWAKPQHVDHMGDIKALLTEVLFLHATFEHNLPLWFRTYPFHVGLYMLMGGAIILVLVAFLRLFGACPDGGFLTFVFNVVNAISLFGMLGVIGGGIGLIHRRMNDAGLKRYTTPEHYFNLAAFIAFAVVGLAAWVVNPSFARLSSDFIYNLLTFNFEPIAGRAFGLHMLIGYFLMIWIPMTHMGHLFMKYFTYHDIRWGDTPTTYSEENKKKLGDVLQYNVTWAASHINPEKSSSKTWVDVATSAPENKA